MARGESRFLSSLCHPIHTVGQMKASKMGLGHCHVMFHLGVVCSCPCVMCAQIDVGAVFNTQCPCHDVGSW
jgi:sorbitol-specific phosphotransferase system component IIA